MENENRRRALRILRVLSVLHVIEGVTLFVLMLVAQSTHGEIQNATPPYYIGAILTFPLPLILAMVGIATFVRGRNCQNRLEASKRVGCLIQFHCFGSILTVLFGAIGAILTGVTGVRISSISYSNEPIVNRGIAITMLVFICLCILSSVGNLVIVCKGAGHFGVRLLTRGQYQISSSNNAAADTYTEPEQTVIPVVQVRDPLPRIHPNHHHHRENSRTVSPPPDYSTHHLQHFLTEQYRQRIRKRRKKSRRRNREIHPENENGNNGELSRRQRERQAPYVIPTSSVTMSSVPRLPALPSQKRHAPPPPRQPSPPPPPMNMYPPPSPTPPASPLRLESPIRPSSPQTAISKYFPVSDTPRSPPAESPSGAQPTNSAVRIQSPPLSASSTKTHPTIIHVIPYGAVSEEEDEEKEEYDVDLSCSP